jgi:hypothetical protein
MGLKIKDSCGDSFKEMKILPLWCQHMYSLMQYVVNNGDVFTRNTEVHNKSTRQNINLFLLLKFKWKLYSGIKICNHIPKKLKQLASGQKSFGPTLKRFSYVNSFYLMEEYFNYKCQHT